MPPIKPSTRYSNFDTEYTCRPVMFTFDEDFVTEGHQRRKSDPGIEKSFLKQEPSQLPLRNNLVNEEEKVGPNQNRPDEGSPHFSRPPSSTFRGYSFMNFRRDSNSSHPDANSSFRVSYSNTKVDKRNIPGNQQSPLVKPTYNSNTNPGI